ncbi:uncharacterized protein LOC114840354 isoform X1 [Tachysurus ichikawai]
MESIEGKGKRILRFFQEKPTNKEVCAVLSKYQEGNFLVLCILKLLLAHFKERTESLLIEADAAATAADMEREGLPDSPALIIQDIFLKQMRRFTSEGLSHVKGLVGINPETGSKVAAGKRDKKMHGMNPHVCTLLRKLMDFEWLVI